MKTSAKLFNKTLNFFFLVSFWAILVSVVLFASVKIRAQGSQPPKVNETKFDADKILRSNARVNPSTLAMEFSIPLAAYAGRAGHNVPPVSLYYSSKVWNANPSGTWRTQHGTTYTDIAPKFAERSASGWTSGFDVPSIDGEVAAYDQTGQAFANMRYFYNSEEPPDYHLSYVKRLRLTMPDGSMHELRKDDVVFQYGTADHPDFPTDIIYSGTYLSVDGSRMRLEWFSDGGGNLHNILYLPDGSRYLDLPDQLGGSSNTAYIDRHGNRATYNSVTAQWTDTIGRNVKNPLPFDINNPQPSEGVKNFSYPGINGVAQQYQMVWQTLDTQQPGAEYLSDYYCYGNLLVEMTAGLTHLFTSINPGAGGLRFCGQPVAFNPTVLTEVRLPNNAKYRFSYNIYGEIERIDYPIGGYERFEYSYVPPIASTATFGYNQVNRGVAKRWISADGTSAGETLWRYEVQRETSATQQGAYHVKTFAPDETWSEQLSKDQWSKRSQPYGFGDPSIGRAYEEKAYSATDSQLLRRKLTQWTTTNLAGVVRDLRPLREINIVFEPGAATAVAAMSETEYDTAGSGELEQFAALNPKRIKSYKYKTLDLNTAQTGTIETIAAIFAANDVQSIAETDYLYDETYKARGITGLPVEQRVMNPISPANFIAKSQTFYDEATYPIIPAGAVTGWEDPGAAAKRGLVTTTRAWNSSANNGAGGWTEAHMQYDNFGNLRKMWDAGGNLSETEYSADYNFAFPTKVVTPVPGDGTHGSATAFVTTMTYDPITGLPLTTTDSNGVTTMMEYNDPLLRPTRVSQSVLGQPVGAASETSYGVPDSNGQLSASQRFVHSKSQIDADNFAESWTRFDGLGRSVVAEKKDAGGNVFVETRYDNMSRPFQQSNPYRAGTTEANKLWTTTVFDNLSRVQEIQSPLEAGQSAATKVLTSYGLATTTGAAIGTVVTVTDQAGKQRRSVTNALGQLVRVDEPNAQGQLDNADDNPVQPTNYSYDALGNLTSVVQTGSSAAQCGAGSNTCSQTRTFVYDSLSRLKSAQNPESGLISYSYDANGNLQTKTAARDAGLSIKTVYAYDNLNRVTSREYRQANDAALPAAYATPSVEYFYDGIYRNAAGQTGTATGATKGKLTGVKSAVSVTNYTAFDALGRILDSSQETDGQTFRMGYSYNLSGMMVSERYPSGRIVRNEFDADGDLQKVASQRGGAARTFASSFAYTAAGAVERMQMGNGRWETTLFNNRLQPVQLGLGTTNNAANADLWKATFDYGAADNNGNVKSQTVTVPSVTANGTTAAGFTAVQNYNYDSLNRLLSASETISNQQTWRQTFVYDRFGNRRFDYQSGATTVPAIGSGEAKVINPEIDPTNNRLKRDQGGATDAYLYDSAGNLTRDAAGKRFDYDAENKQVRFFQAGNASADADGKYFYDGDGRRIKKVDDIGAITIFVYDAGGKMVAEYSNHTAANTEPQTSYLTNDHLGSPRVITDQTGKVTSRRDFLPFGEDLSTPQRTPQLGYLADTVRQKFTGYEKDTESDLDFAQARYYNSKHGRFISVDPIYVTIKRLIDPQQLNLYAYTRNNPLKFIDPSGMELEVKAKNEEEARKRFKLLQKGLLKKDRDKVQLVIGDGKNGFAKGAFGVKVDEKHKSNSQNFQMLQKVAGDKGATAVIQFIKQGEAVPANFGRQQGQKSILVPFKQETGVDFTMGLQNGFDFRGWTTYPLENPPSDEGFPIYSDDNKTRANIYEVQTEEEILVTMYHELAAHVYLSNVGREPPKGAHGRPQVESEAKRAESEAKTNYKQK